MNRVQPFLAAAALVLAATAAQAGEEKPLWEVGAGAGAFTFPAYRGSDKNSTWLLPVPYFTYHGDFFKADRHGIRGSFFDTDRLDLTVSAFLSPPSGSDDIPVRAGMLDLKATFETLSRRVPKDPARPLWDENARALLLERAAAYGDADVTVQTDGLTVQEVLEAVAGHVEGLREPVPVLVPSSPYPVYTGRGAFRDIRRHLSRHIRPEGIFALVDEAVMAHHGPIIRSSLPGTKQAVMTVPSGEASKSFSVLTGVLDEMFSAQVNRQWVCLAVGGGVTGDLAAFASSIFMRGIPVVQVPTTLLSQVDSSIGGKTGIDVRQGKNLVGAFKQPSLVVADVETLGTLPPAELANGLAEAVKTGIIGDPLLFRQIEEHGPAPLPWIVARAVDVKVAVVQADPYERGVRATLNLGHTFGHALERLSNYALPHGAAVAAGLVASARLAARLGLCDPGLAPRVAAVLGRLGLPTGYGGYDPEQVWQAMGTDKKRQAGRLRFVLPRDLGDMVVSDAVPREDVLAVLETMREEET